MLLILAGAAWGAACLNLEDPAGRRCDQTHGCRDGRQCIDGFCRYPSVADGGPDGGACAGASCAGTDAGLPPGTLLFREDFESYATGAWPSGSAQGPWNVEAGEGTVAVAQDTSRVLQVSPRLATSFGERYTAHVTTTSSFEDLDLRGRLRFTLSPGADPDALAALEWHGQADGRSYFAGFDSFGWLVGKRTATGVQVLGQGNLPFIPNETWVELRVTQVAGAISVTVGGAEVVKVTDPDPLLSGPIALSIRQGTATFDDVSVHVP